MSFITFILLYVIGTIPLSIQSKTWNSLELSYNKFGGTLSKNMTVDSDYFAVDNNR